jgi:hypothetical protein
MNNVQLLNAWIHFWVEIVHIDDLCVLECKRIQKETSFKHKTWPCSLKLGVTSAAYSTCCSWHLPITRLPNEWNSLVGLQSEKCIWLPYVLRTVTGHLITNNIHWIELTPWIRAKLGNLKISWFHNKFLAFFGTRRIISAFIRVFLLSLFRHALSLR